MRWGDSSILVNHSKTESKLPQLWYAGDAVLLAELEELVKVVDNASDALTSQASLIDALCLVRCFSRFVALFIHKIIYCAHCILIQCFIKFTCKERC